MLMGGADPIAQHFDAQAMGHAEDRNSAALRSILSAAAAIGLLPAALGPAGIVAGPLAGYAAGQAVSDGMDGYAAQQKRNEALRGQQMWSTTGMPSRPMQQRGILDQ